MMKHDQLARSLAAQHVSGQARKALSVINDDEVAVQGSAGILVPAGIPMPIVPKLNAAINDIVGSADMQANLDKISAKSQLGSPQQFAEFMAAQTKTWSEIVKAGDIKAD